MPQLAAAGVQTADFPRRERAPALPDGSILAVGEGVLGIELQFVDLEPRQLFGQVEEGFQFGHPAARDIQHYAAPRKVRPVADFEARQTAAELPHQLRQRGRGRPQAGRLPKLKLHPVPVNRQRVSLRLSRRGVGAENFDGGSTGPRWQSETARKSP